MKKVLPDILERGRCEGDQSWGAYGAFLILGPCGERLVIVASGADEDDKMSQGWEHVSVSTRRRCPNWAEMNFVKDLFWDAEECVVQFHPPKSQYVNNHEFVLHLWRPADDHIRLPPSILVGLKTVGLLTPAEAAVVRNIVQRVSR